MSITKEGKLAIEKEIQKEQQTLNRLRLSAEEVRRVETEISENGAYWQIRNEIATSENKIKGLEKQLLQEESDMIATEDGIVGIGAVIEVADDEGEKFSLEIVSEGLSAPLENKVTLNSPLVSKCVGRCEGDEIEVEVQGNVIKYTILKIRKALGVDEAVCACL